MRKPFAEYRAFIGERNVGDPLAFKAGEVQEAFDIDFDIDRYAHRKQHGSTLLIAGIYDNLWSNGKICLCTQNGNLYRLHEDFTTLTLLRADVGDNPMSYCDVAGTGIVYYSNGAVIGYVRDGQNYVMPSTTVRDRINTPPMYPIEYFGNRLWGFVGDVLIKTDPDQLFLFNRVNMEGGFYQRKGQGTLLKAVQDGLYIADGSHWFIANAGREAESIRFICDYDAITGMVTQNPVDVETITTEGTLSSGKGHLWVTEKGIRYGLAGGISGNFTRKRISIPASVRGACLHRNDDDGFNQFIAVLRN